MKFKKVGNSAISVHAKGLFWIHDTHCILELERCSPVYQSESYFGTFRLHIGDIQLESTNLAEVQAAHEWIRTEWFQLTPSHDLKIGRIQVHDSLEVLQSIGR